MTRDETLKAIKERALECLPNCHEAFGSFISDMSKDWDGSGPLADWNSPIYGALAGTGMMHVTQADEHGLKLWIEGFT